MNDQTDSQLLRRYAKSRSEESFTFLVSRHVDFVYSAARRMVVDPHLAEDVTQGVFVALAKNAGQLTDRAVLSGWLHRTAQNIAAQTVRTIERRRAREQEAAAMNELLSAESDASWDDISPHLDTALGELNEPDRDALLLRYFEKKSAREMAQTLGISDEAAQKRVNRAVDRLREIFSKQGFTLGASGLVALISVNAVHAAPVGLIATISTAVVLGGTSLTAGTITKTIVMTTLQKTLVTIVLIAGVATPFVMQHLTNAQLQNENHALQQQIKQQEQQAEERLAQAKMDQGEMERLRQEHSELLRLRGQNNRQRTSQPSVKSSDQSLAQTDAPVSPAAKADELLKDSWGDVGFATPQTALQTRGWTVLNGHRERFAESVFVTDGARKTLEDMLVKMAEASNDPNKAQYLQEILNNKFGVEDGILMPMMAENQTKGYTSYRILSQQSPSADEMMLEVETLMASAPSKQETLKFRRIGNDWKVVIDEEFIKSRH